MFSGQGEEIGYIYDKPIDITIPEGVSVSEGLKRMRLVMDYSNEPQPCGSYYFGETEDYGILVKHNDNTPSVSTDLKEISEESADGTSRLSSIEVSNVGNALLDASVNISYKLPDVYEGRSLAPAGEFKSTLKRLKKTVASTSAVSTAEKAEQSQAPAEYVLRYDGGYSSSVQLGNFTSCIFANYYPREKMAALKGMRISSVEVYIKDLPGGTKIKVFGQGVDRAHSGAVLTEQEFEAQADCWNVVTLDNPVEITGEDIWFGVEMTDMSADKFHIGIDDIPAVAGYGDVCNVGGETWWSMADLGVDSNFCVRANVTGKRSAFIDWIHLDKTALSLGAGESAVVKATLDPAGLTDGMYEAAIEIRSNDELESVRAIPVYFTNGVWASIDTVSVDGKSEIKLTADGIAVTSGNAISEIRIVDLSGRVVSVDEVGATTAVVPVDALADGVYVLSVSYVDGDVESMKFAIAR